MFVLQVITRHYNLILIQTVGNLWVATFFLTGFLSTSVIFVLSQFVT